MAIRFDAAGEGLSRSANLPSATAFTLCGWFNIRGSGAGTNEYLFVIGDTGGTDSLVFYTRVSGTYGVQLYSPAAGAPVSAGSISTGQWYFGALSCAGTGATDAKARFAALGATTFSSASVPGVAFTPATLAVGDTLSHGQWANAAVAGWKLFDRALTDAELLAEMNRLTPASTTNLNVWSPMVHDTVANAIKDLSGNGRDWTANGTLTIEDGPPVGWGGRVTVVGQAAAGTTYDDSLTESVTAADSLANSATFGPSLSESATVADSYATAATFESALTESVAADDALAAGQVMPVALAESATVADDYAAAVSKDEAITETVTVADSLAAVQVFAEAPSEAVTLGESLDAGLLIAAVFSEGITLDATLAETISKDETLEESLTLADALSSTLLASATVSEGLPLDTTLAIEAVYNETLSEGLTLAVDLADEHIQGGVYNDTLTETLTLDDSYASTLSAAEALSEGITLDASFYTPPLGQSVHSGGGGGGRAWGWELDREVEEEMGVLLEGPPLTPATIEAVARRLDAPTESRIIGLKQPPVPAVSFDAAMVRRRRIRRRLLLLL